MNSYGESIRHIGPKWCVCVGGGGGGLGRYEHPHINLKCDSDGTLKMFLE